MRLQYSYGDSSLGAEPGLSPSIRVRDQMCGYVAGFPVNPPARNNFSSMNDLTSAGWEPFGRALSEQTQERTRAEMN